jgi:small nuclear ribonucleoprotein (snRNP)-like protein
MERIGERVQIILKNNFSYTGTIIDEDDFFIIINDIYNSKVSLSKSEIQTIKEVRK